VVCVDCLVLFVFVVLFGWFKAFSPNLPVIAQTAYAVFGDEEKSLLSGCDDYISKPINRELLIEKIQALLKIEKL
jgi:CheY-like chemotaxis protein